MQDKLLTLSDGQDVTGAAASTVYSAAQQIGALGEGYQSGAAIVKVRDGYTGTGSLQATLQHSDDDGDGAPAGWEDAGLAGAVLPIASLVQGAKLLNNGLPANIKEHVRFKYDITVNTLSDGTIDARFDLAPETDPVNNS